MNRNTLTFEANVPYDLALKYESGREISNGRIMFTTTQNECFFLDPEDARKIYALGLSVNEPFRIMKRFAGKKAVYGCQPDSGAAAGSLGKSSTCPSSPGGDFEERPA